MPITKGLAIKIFEQGFVNVDLPQSIGQIIRYDQLAEENTEKIGFILNLKPKRLIIPGIIIPMVEIKNIEIDDEADVRNNGFCRLIKALLVFQTKEIAVKVGTKYVNIKDLYE